MQFVVLSSSRGTTFQAVIDAMKEGRLTAECLGLISDREDRGCVEKARKAELPVVILERKKGEGREEYDRRLRDAITDLSSIPAYRQAGPDSSSGGGRGDVIIAALGWMYLLSAWFTVEFHNRIINVHPALLPKHPGAQAVEETISEGDRQSGMTIHFIDEGLDTGKIIVQKKCSVEKDDTVETLKVRIQELEKEWYPKVLQMIEKGELQLPA